MVIMLRMGAWAVMSSQQNSNLIIVARIVVIIIGIRHGKRCLACELGSQKKVQHWLLAENCQAQFQKDSLVKPN